MLGLGRLCRGLEGLGGWCVSGGGLSLFDDWKGRDSPAER